MKIIYCCNPINNRVVDFDFENEYESASKNGFEIELINFEALINNNVNKAIKTIYQSESPEPAIFRGWMLTPEQYELLYDGLKDKNIQLINNPQEYLNCHYFPQSYEIIKEKTPESIWFKVNKDIDFDLIMEKLKLFNGKPIMLKDYVKSQKHRWKEACYINSANDLEEVKNIVNKFIELQGTNLNKGLVFREFCQLEFIGEHSKSKMPLTKEFRMFFLNGKLVNKYNYWDEGNYQEENIDLDEFINIAKNIKSNFFTMDIAKTVDGKWLIIELGDGQVAGLPDNANTDLFYKKIKEML